MPIVDPDTGEISNAAFAIDDHAATMGEPSVLDSATNLVTKALPLTALSVVNSFANTGIEVGNWLTGDNNEKLSVQNELGDGSLTDYYNAHSQGIETAGLIAGSLLPGLGAIKGASAAVKAVYLARTGLGSEALAEATGLLAPLKAAVVSSAKNEIEQGDAALFGSLTKEKAQAIALGYGDQALQGLVYSAATAATMHASPLLDQETLGDTATDMFYGAVTGGLIGGSFEAIGTRALFNKGIFNADDAAKAQQLTTRLGLGNYTAGDRATALLDSLDKIPDATSSLQAKHLQMTTDSATMEFKRQLGTLVPEGDEDVSNGAAGILLKMHGEGGESREDMYQYTSRLAKISRYTGDDTGTIPTGDTFFINRFAKGEGPATWDSLVTSSPSEEAQFSLKYSLLPDAMGVNIAKFGEKFISPDGGEHLLYPTAQEAWDAGHDIYIGKDLKISVNLDSENLTSRLPAAGENRVLSQKELLAQAETGSLPEGSKPLTGAPLVLNTKTGGVSTTAIPVVGDFGKPLQLGDNLKYGEQISQQGIGKVLDASTPTIDANARYVWAEQRGVKAGDTITSSDVPMMEQLYYDANGAKEGFQEHMNFLKRSGVTMADGAELPSNPQALLSQIQDAKNKLIADTMNANPKMGTEEVAIRANVPEQYITSGLKAQDSEAFMRETTDYLTPNHVKLEYDIGSTSQPDGQILRGIMDTQYRISIIRNAAQDAMRDYLGSVGKGNIAENFLIDSKASSANILGMNSQGFISASNAEYGSLGQETQRVGKLVTLLSTERMAAISEKLSPSVNALRSDAQASAELGLFRAVRQRTGAAYTFLPAEVAQRMNISADTAVLTKSIIKDADGNITGWNKDYLPDNFLDGSAAAEGKVGNYSFYNLSPKVAAFERAQQDVNDARLVSRNNWLMAQGKDAKFKDSIGNLYTPPIDTAKYPYFAYVKNRAGTGMADDGTAVITAASQEELQEKISALTSDFSVFTKGQLAEHHEVVGDYEYNRNFAQGSVNSALERKGILNNILPDTRASTIIKDYIDWNSKQELALIRDHVELGNGQLFAELRAMGERFRDTGTSETGFVSNFTRRTTFNPYDAYIKQSLGVSPKDTNYPLWAWANEKAEAFWDTAFKTAQYAFQAAHAGILPYEQASEMASKFGLGNPYEAAVGSLRANGAYYNIANKLPDAKFLSTFMHKANAIMGATVIRLDTWQQLIHITASPILMTAEANSALSGKGYPELARLLTTELPDGTSRVVPSVSKVMFNAVKNYFDPAVREQWLQVFKDNGIIRDSKVLDQHYEAINDLALPYGGKGSIAKATENLKSAGDFAAKYITGSDFSNNLLHYMSADMGRQIFEAAGYNGKQLLDNIATFQNRVFGNFVASQRPVAFQGPIGQAVGLFQTYYFNLMQQVLRYVENGEGKTLAIAAGLQTTLFGMQSLPGFQLINNHLIGNAAGNPTHGDLYSAIPNLLDKKLGDFLTYGAVSNFTGAGLYTRGDINPRSVTLLPTNPLDFPAVRGAIRFSGAMLDTAAKIAKGGNIPASIMIGLEHNGLSRPLAGLAQLMQGFATTSAGSLISSTGTANTMGLSDLFSAANFSRLLGARPLDEAVAMDDLYRSTLYKAKDTSRIAALGSAVRTDMYNGQYPDTNKIEDFAQQYAAAGGRIENFSAKMSEWSSSANASVANKVFTSLKGSASAKNMMQIMGGQPLPDYLHGSILQGSSTEGSAASNPKEGAGSIVTGD